MNVRSRVYTPDRWQIAQVIPTDNPDNTIERVFAGWHGGYMDSDEWKMSSQIQSVVEHKDRYEFQNESGSTYVCYKNRVGMTSLMGSVLLSFNSSDQLKVNIIDEIDFVDTLPGVVWENHWMPDRPPRERCKTCGKIVVGLTMEEAQARADRIHERSGRKMYPYIGKDCGYFHLTRKLKRNKNVNA